MMGLSHAVSGAAVWVALTMTSETGFPSLGWLPTDPVSVLLGAVICAGAALLPDADHHDATIAHSIPVVGRAAAGAIGVVTGGHRKGMHSLLAVAGIVFAMIGLSHVTYTPEGWDRALQIGSAFAVCACMAFASKSLRLARSWLKAWLVGLLVAVGVLLWAPEEFVWLPICIGVGYLTHLVGDILTVQGVPLLWPLALNPPDFVASTPVLSAMWLPKGAFAVPILGRAGSIRESIVALAMAGYVIWGLIVAGFALV